MTTPFRMSRIGRQSLVYGAGIVLSKVAAFVMLPLYTNYLSPAEYGTLQLVDMTIEIASIVAGSRLALGIFHFYHKADTDDARREVIGTALALLVTLYAAAGAVTFALAPALSRLLFGDGGAADLIRIGAASLAVQSLLVVTTAHLRLRERSAQFVAVNAVKLVIQLALNVLLLVVVQMGAAGILTSTLVANALVGGYLAVGLVREVAPRVAWPRAVQLVRFGAPLIAVHLAKFIGTYADRYLLKAFASTAVVGLYALAYQFGFLLVSLGDAPYNSVWEPLRFEVARRPDRDTVYARAFLHFNLLLLTVALAITLYVPEFLRVMTAPAFHVAAAWVPVILVAYVFQSWSNFHNAGLYVMERTDLFTRATWAGAAVAVLGYLLLIPSLLALGAALATLASFVVTWVLVYRSAQRLWPVAWGWRPVLRLAAAALLVGAVAQLVQPAGLLAALAVKTALFLCYVALVWLAGVLPDDDRALVRTLVTSPRSAVALLRGSRA